MAVSKRTRFEVFKRDKFACQYCGRCAPDVLLECDHIQPKAKGGEDDLSNLVTSCRECNAGKSDKPLSDDSTIKKQQRQFAELQERREQIEMMLEWHRGLSDLDAEALSALAVFWNEQIAPWEINDAGRQEIRRWLCKYGLAEILQAMRTSAAQYLATDDKGRLTEESMDKAWAFIPKICAIARVEKDKPEIKELLYIRGIVRNRYRVQPSTLGLVCQNVERAYQRGMALDELARLAKHSRNVGAFMEAIQGDWKMNG